MTASTSSSIRWRRPSVKNGVEVRLIARNNEMLATRTTDASGHALFEAGLARGEGGSAPAHADRDRATRRLCLPQPESAGLRSHRPRRRPAGRRRRARRLRLCRARRLSLRRNRLSHRAAARRAGRRGAGRAADAGGRAAGRRRIPPRRAGGSGRGRPQPDVAARRPAPTGTWRVRAFTDPKRPPVGETTFMVEDYVPDRIEFDLTSPSGQHLARSSRPRSRSTAASSTARRPRASISKATCWSRRRQSGRVCRLSVRRGR